MIALEMADLKEFTAGLFLKETFDSFELVEAEFHTDITVTLDGNLTEPEKGAAYAPWSTVRPLAFAVIKGKKLPHSFHIVLRLSDSNTENTLRSMGLDYSVEEVGGLFLNIRYDNKRMSVVTGCSFKTFRLDRTLEKEWDKVIERFLRHHRLPFQAMV